MASKTRTFLVEVCFDKPPESAEQERYIIASLEEIGVLWHDYMATKSTKAKP